MQKNDISRITLTGVCVLVLKMHFQKIQISKKDERREYLKQYIYLAKELISYA